MIAKVRRAASILREDGPWSLVTFAARSLGLGGHAPEEAAMVFRLLRAASTNGVMVDVGAHIGTASLPFARSGWRVFAFEPDPSNRGQLERAVASFPRVLVDPRALADQPRQQAPFYTSRVSTGISGLTAFHPSHVVTSSIDVTTLRDFCAEHPLERVDFLKVDTEGFDLFVLRGVPWEQFNPRVIVCEFEDAKTRPLGYSFQDLARLLIQQHYALVVSEWYPVRRYGGPHRWRRFARYPCDLVDGNAWGNIIAVQDPNLLASLLSLCEAYGPVTQPRDATPMAE
ncbi:MAG TPA: FkbM family methyltransferase [Vicinamibacterales bacterium]|nr:FkbM family methyltransferase [Vicinamibacterales bacterium]